MKFTLKWCWPWAHKFEKTGPFLTPVFLDGSSGTWHTSFYRVKWYEVCSHCSKRRLFSDLLLSQEELSESGIVLDNVRFL